MDKFLLHCCHQYYAWNCPSYELYLLYVTIWELIPLLSSHCKNLGWFQRWYSNTIHNQCNHNCDQPPDNMGRAKDNVTPCKLVGVNKDFRCTHCLCLHHHSSTLIMQAASSTKTLVHIHQTIQHHTAKQLPSQTLASPQQGKFQKQHAY